MRRVAGRERHLPARCGNRSAARCWRRPCGERPARRRRAPSATPISDLDDVDRNDRFDLVAGAEAPLVDQLVADRRLRAAGDRVREDHFVLGERLFREDGAREIQIAARPRAGREQKPANVADGRGDLLRRQGIAEGRHAIVTARECARPRARRPSSRHPLRPSRRRSP